jgi:aspartate/methionine/tyrosine aminotransferase
MEDLETRNRYFDELFNTRGLRWLGQNTNHHPTHPAVKKALIQAIENEEYHAYAPPVGLEELRHLILDDVGLPNASIMITDGAIEGLYHACRTFCGPGDEFITADPGWKWPTSFVRAVGGKVIELPVYEAAQDYRLTPAQLSSAITEKTRIIYIIDPNNPLGVCYPSEDVRAFADIAREADAYLIHDCTYRQFADNHTLAARFYPEKTIMTYSFSKWLGLAGLRLGALISHPSIIETLAEAAPNNLGSNVLSQRAAIAGLKVKAEWLPEIQAEQRRNQTLIRDASTKIKGLSMPIYPSQGNFVVIDCKQAGIRPEALVEGYRAHRIMIRHAGYHTQRYADRFIKISTTVPIGWVEELCQLMPQIVDEAAGRSGHGALY